MSGYNYNTWRSNNCEKAYDAGLLTAGDVVKQLKKAGLKISAKELTDKKPIRYKERHHTGSKFAWTYFYEQEDVNVFLESDLFQKMVAERNNEGVNNDIGRSASVTYATFSASGKFLGDETRVGVYGESKSGRAFIQFPSGSKKYLDGNAIREWDFV